MKLFAPSYYKKFKCLAGACRHSCCVGWEIDVDEDSLSRYRALGDAGKDILSGIELSGEAPHFRLSSEERCPNLLDNGLCRIISDFGEGYLCDICREHPRFYNYLPDRCEGGLGACCEEAARLILSCENYSDIAEVGEDGTEPEGEYSPLLERARVYAILSDKSLTLEARLSGIYTEFGVHPSAVGAEVIGELEYLDSASLLRFSSYRTEVSSPISEFSERALAYFVYRHTGSAADRGEFLLSLGAALFLERLFSSVMESEKCLDLEAAAQILRLISEEIEYNEDNVDLIKNAFL